MVVVAGMVLFAGCAGSFGGAQATPPDGFDGDGVSDWAVALAAHEAAVLDAESFTVRFAQETATENPLDPTEVLAQQVSGTYKVDIGAGAMWSEQSVLNGITTPGGTPQTRTDIEVYQVDRTQYIMTEGGDQQQYHVSQTAFDTDRMQQHQMVEMLLKSLAFERQDDKVVGGESRFVYEATAETAASELVAEGVTATTEDLHGRLVVDAEGRIHELAVVATIVPSGETQPPTNVDISLIFSDFGETSVQEPTWTKNV